MRFNRIAVLVSKEFLYGSKNLIFIMAVVMPVLFSLVISLMVGTIFSGKPRLGIADQGSSQLTENMAALDYLVTSRYDSSETLRADVERGALDMGVVLPANFDANLKSNAQTSLDVQMWGESLLKHRTVLGVTLIRQVIAVAGREIPVNTETVLLGNEVNVPWGVRLFPFVVIITIMLGGMMVPATSLVEEKTKRTLRALIVTPASIGDIITAKGLTGVIIAIVMGLVILALNNAFGSRPALLLMVLFISAVFSAVIGMILGAVVKDINTLFTIIKSMGIFLYAPAIVYLFPQIPQWVAKLFPTYYTIGPIVELTLNNGGWSDIAVDVYILIGLTLLLAAVALLLARRASELE